MSDRNTSRPITTHVRPEVAAFAEMMENKLRRHNRKCNWRDQMTPYRAYALLLGEVDDLGRAILDKDPRETATVAAEIANTVMIIPDLMKGDKY